MPFAGLRQSGLGTGGVPYLHEMTIDKMIVCNLLITRPISSPITVRTPTQIIHLDRSAGGSIENRI